MNRTLYYYLFGKFRSRLTSAENAIANKISADDLDTAIAGKADANDVFDLADRVTSAENAITGKADASDLSTLAGRVTDAETAISGKAVASDVTTLAGRVTQAENAIFAAKTAISGKASASDLSTLAGRVSDAEGTIAEHTTSLSGKASASDLSTLAGRVSTAEETISGHTTAIAGKASASDLSTLAGRVSDAETAISGKASASDLSTLAGRVTSAEGTISDHTTAISKKAPEDITKFEVYATNAVIPAGTVDSDTGLAYAVEVPAGMKHVFKLRSDTLQVLQDVVIEWGDGASSSLKNGNFDSIDDSEYAENGELVYIVSHTYNSPGKYIVTIHGKEYWGFQMKGDDVNTPSILSRIFAADLPVASCVTNLSTAARGSLKLQKVLIPTGMDLFSNIHNASVIFSQCKNLISATNFATKFQFSRYVQQMFHSCENMTTCDFRIPPNCLKEVGSRQVFYNCKKLNANVADLLPERGFNGASLNFMDTFRGCAALTGTVPASILWNDKRIKWSNTDNAFTGCPAEIRAQVPVSWGGTAAEPEVGAGNVVGGYTAKILTYEESSGAYRLYLEPDSNNEVDYTKFKAGNSIRISLIESDEFATAVISSVDSTNKRLNLTASLYGTSITSNTTIGMEKKAVSGYTASATGGPSVYRVTYSGAGTAEELFEGRTIYTRAGSGAFNSNSIAGTSGNYIYLTSAAAGTTAIYLAPSSTFVLVSVIDPEDTSTASGEYNMVAGEASSANGAYNAVSGIGNAVSGSVNTVQGENNFVLGDNNTVAGFSITVLGGSNSVLDGNVFVIGNQNRIFKQGAVVLGDMNAALAVNAFAFGWGNILKAYGGMGIGTRNTISGKWSVAVGYANKVGAETAYVVGRYADVPDAAENKNAFIIWGGEHQNNSEAFAVRPFRKELNPLFNSASLAPGSSLTDPNPKDSAGEKKYNSIPAYRTEFKGQLKPKTQTIAVSGSKIVTLDTTMYSRVMLTGSGTVTFDIEDYAEDGDKIQLILDSNWITPVFPAAWVTLGADVSTDPGLYVLEVAKVGSTIFYKVLYPDLHIGKVERSGIGFPDYAHPYPINDDFNSSSTHGGARRYVVSSDGWIYVMVSAIGEIKVNGAKVHMNGDAGLTNTNLFPVAAGDVVTGSNNAVDMVFFLMR